MGGRRFYYPADTEAFLNDKAAPVMDGGCGAEDYLILQLRLRKGLDLAAYKARYGKEFSTAQFAFVKNCVKSGYATFDGSTCLTPPDSSCRTAFWRSCCDFCLTIYVKTYILKLQKVLPSKRLAPYVTRIKKD